MYFQDTLLLSGLLQAAAEAPLHVVTVYNFLGATRNEKNRKYQNIGTQGVQEVFCFVNRKVSEIAELNR